MEEVLMKRAQTRKGLEKYRPFFRRAARQAAIRKIKSGFKELFNAML